MSTEPKGEDKSQRHWCDLECLKSHPTRKEEKSQCCGAVIAKKGAWYENPPKYICVNCQKKVSPTRTEEWKCPCGRPALKFDICDSAECKEKYVLKEDKPAEWEEHFKNKYVRDDGLMDEYYDGGYMADEIISFIHSLLKEEKERMVEEISGIAEMSVGNWTEHAKTNIRKDKLALQDAANEGWNNCRKLILSLIKGNNE